MFVERRQNPNTGVVELWWCDWHRDSGGHPKKVQISKISDEAPALTPAEEAQAKSAICWSYGNTVANVAVTSQALLGTFPNKEGNDAKLLCDFVKTTKFRNGAERWWCRTHQTYWGRLADIASYQQTQVMECSEHDKPMSYVVDPLVLNISEYEEVGIWCSMPAALSTEEIIPRPPKIHVHVRPKIDGRKSIDRDYQAISVIYSDRQGLFGSDDIKLVNITPPSAFDFVTALEDNREMSCVNCSRCGYPHLDLGSFAKNPHKKHYCGNCGFDSTQSKGLIVSTPLKLLHDQFARTLKYEVPNRTLNLDEFTECTFTVWASTPAIVWTAARPQELGIHVHVHEGPRRIIDDTFGEIMYKGKNLDRVALIKMMEERSIV